MGRSRAVFLDRDGVLNEAVVRHGRPYPPKTPAEVVITDGAAQALAQLKQAGFLLLVVTNQPDVARGTATRSDVDEINRSLSEHLPLDGFFLCCHDDLDHCECRKPKPGLLFEAVAKHNIDLRGSFMIGDRWRDIDAGHAAGCSTILIDYGYAERGPTSVPDATVTSLQQAVSWILARERPSR